MSAWGTFIRHGHAQKCHRYNLAKVKREKRIQPSACFSLYSFLPTYSISSCSSLPSIHTFTNLDFKDHFIYLQFGIHVSLSYHFIVIHHAQGNMLQLCGTKSTGIGYCLSLNLITYLACLMIFQFEPWSFAVNPTSFKWLMTSATTETTISSTQIAST